MANLTGVIKTQKPGSVGIATPSVGIKLPAITQPKYDLGDVTKGREEKFTEWETKKNVAVDQMKILQEQMNAVKVKNAAMQAPKRKWYNMVPVVNIVTTAIEGAHQQKANVQEAKIKIAELTEQHAVQYMYASLYTTIPNMISTGQVESVEEAVAKLPIPNAVSDSELGSIKSTLADMFSTLTQQDMAEEVEQQNITEPNLFPALIQPSKSESMLTDSVQDLTVAELARTFQPLPIESAMSDSQWKQVLSGEGYSEADLETISIIDKEIEEAMANMAEYKIQLAAFEANAGKMDDYSTWDMVKLAVETPGIALLDLANYYFEHVTMPTAGTVWRELAGVGAHAPVIGAALDHINDDMEKSYSEARSAGKSPWESAKLSWEDWDCNWFLKYVVMEGLVDPTTYLGTGLVSRIIKPTTKVGRMVEVVDKGFREVSELPFDAFKSWMKDMPKTAYQRGMMRQITGWGTVKSAITASSNKSIRQIPISEFSDKLTQWVDLAMTKPYLETKPVLAAKELLRHAPLGENDLSRWSGRMGHSVNPEDISHQMLESADNLFESVFEGKLTAKEAAPELSRILTHGITDDSSKIAEKLIETRKSAIVTNAKSFSKYPSTYKASRAIQEKILKTHLAIEESTLYLAKNEEGRILSTLQHLEPEVLAAWRQTIDKGITKPFAEAYLCFSAYGFMNVLEDSMRSALDGVYPRRLNNELRGIVTIGLLTDPTLDNLSISDMIGVIKKELPEHYHQNWIMRLSALGSEKWSSRFYEAMVHAPGMISADLKRNFEVQLMMRNLMDSSEPFREMMKGIPEITGALAKDKKFKQELGKLIYYSVASANPHVLDMIPDMLHSKTITISKVKDVFAKYPELSKAPQNIVLDAIESGEIFQEISKAAKNGAEATAKSIEHQDSITKVMLKSESALIDDLLMKPDAAIGQFDGLYKHLVEAEMSNPEEMANLLMNLRIMSDLYGKTPQQILSAASLQSRGMKFGDRSAVMGQALENTQKLVDRAGISLDNVVSDFKTKIEKLKLPADREAATRDYLDTVQRQYLATEIYADRIAEFRRLTFGSAKPSDLKSNKWWEENFYGPHDELLGELKQVSAQGLIDSHNAAKRAEAVFGAVETPRPPIVVNNREISASDVSKLVQARPSDMTSAIMDTMSVMGDRETYVAYVMSHVKTGDVGFTPEAIGKVFDSLVYQTGNDPATLSWLTKQRHDLKKVEQDIRDMVFKNSVVKDNADELTKYVESVKQYMADKMYDNFPAKKIVRTKVIDRNSGYPALMKQNKDGTWSKISKDELLNYKGAKSKVSAGELPAYNRLDIRKPFRIGKDTIEGETITLTPTKEQIVKLRKEGYDGVQKLDKWVPLVSDRQIKKPAWSGISNISAKSKLKPEFADIHQKRQDALDKATLWLHKAYPDYTNANAMDAIMKQVYPFWCMPEYATILTRDGWKHYTDLRIGEEVLTLNQDTMSTNWEPVQKIESFDFDDDLMVIPAKGKDIEFTPNHRWLVVDKLTGKNIKIKRGFELTDGYDVIPRSLNHNFPTESVLNARDSAILGWCCTDGYINRSAGHKPRMVIYQNEKKFLSEIEALCDKEGVVRKPTGYTPEGDFSNYTVGVRQLDADRILSVCPEWGCLPQLVTKLNKESAQAMWDAMFKAEGNVFNSRNELFRSWKQNPGYVSEAFQLLSVMLGYAITVNGSRINLLQNSKPYSGKECRRITTKHYKGKVWCPVTPSGTWFVNCNGSVIPTGNTYESQRWFYLPRTFLTKPGTFTAYNRWQDNTDSGYVGVPSTPFEVNPFRGTVFGTLSGRLMKQDMSDFSDAPYPLKGLLEYNDFLGRWGFYPGAHFGIPMTLISGGESKLGEAIPAVWSTPLNLLKAAFPDNKLVSELSDRIFPNRFEEYMTAVEATKLGGDGKLIYAKIRENKELTPEEKAIWTEAKRTASLYSALFEQTAFFRLREPEQKRIREIASQLITEWFGISEYQQDWNYRHGIDTWEQIGGLSLSQQQILKELDYYRWTGLSRPIMSSDKQEIYNQLEIAWNDVEKYIDNQKAQKSDLEKQFLSGSIGPSDYITGIKELQAKQSEYIDQKQIEFPAMTLTGRMEMYKKFDMSMPVQHPLVELKNLYFSIELKQKTDPITGEKYDDWDTFWAEREAVESAIPDEYRQEWNTYLEKNMTATEKIRRQSNTEYFSKYNDIYDAVKLMHNKEEQMLIDEYISLKSLGSNLSRQEEILAMQSTTFPGKSLISGFSTEVSHSKESFRAANPFLDAWLFYWGKTTSFKSDQARNIYNTLLSATGRKG